MNIFHICIEMCSARNWEQSWLGRTGKEPTSWVDTAASWCSWSHFAVLAWAPGNSWYVWQADSVNWWDYRQKD